MKYNEIDNFIINGLMGDFIHVLAAVKNICEKNNTKANIYIHKGFRFSIEKTFQDTEQLIKQQKYIKSFNILDNNLQNNNFLEMDLWRKNFYSNPKCWTELLAETFEYSINKTYKWLDVYEKNDAYKNYVVIHRSVERHSDTFDWNEVLNSGNDIRFLISGNRIIEYENFINEFKVDIKPMFVENLYEMAVILNSCKRFVGNQSLPMALASALDIPRVCELYKESKISYENEQKYSANLYFKWN